MNIGNMTIVYQASGPYCLGSWLTLSWDWLASILFFDFWGGGAKLY